MRRVVHEAVWVHTISKKSRDRLRLSSYKASNRWKRLPDSLLQHPPSGPADLGGFVWFRFAVLDWSETEVASQRRRTERIVPWHEVDRVLKAPFLTDPVFAPPSRIKNVRRIAHSLRSRAQPSGCGRGTSAASWCMRLPRSNESARSQMPPAETAEHHPGSPRSAPITARCAGTAAPGVWREAPVGYYASKRRSQLSAK